MLYGCLLILCVISHNDTNTETQLIDLMSLEANSVKVSNPATHDKGVLALQRRHGLRPACVKYIFPTPTKKCWRYVRCVCAVCQCVVCSVTGCHLPHVLTALCWPTTCTLHMLNRVSTFRPSSLSHFRLKEAWILQFLKSTSLQYTFFFV